MINTLKLIGESLKNLFEMAPYFKVIILLIIIGIAFKFPKIQGKILYFIFVIGIYIILKIFIY